MSDKLVLAVPSKGRLQENANAFFARAGLTVTTGRGARDYRGVLTGVENVEVAFLSASEIVKNLASGAAHLGVTGEDLVREAEAQSKVALLTPLGFGHANVVVAVPQAWIDVRNMFDLEDVALSFRARRGERMRVATKYVNTTRAFFREMGVTDYHIVESLGATEGAPAAGQAELIVDITSTGATLAANGLKVLDDGVILRSEANLVASLGAPWTPELREIARKILSRIAAEEEARMTREIVAVLDDEPPGLADGMAAFGAKLRRRGGHGRAIFSAAKAQAPALADWLIGQGAEEVVVRPVDYVFTKVNPLYDRLVSRLDAAGR
ncbi:ATP phosphoribosyltransferase [Rhodoblastus acidophilus]|uniref:ATP phosphoribosyltransferase n=1 Tax=Candidatus Rhodoblastus alkanivorans TaxID=2954117 RepID=A0ABS9Z1L2_9HYPH|nr:ATP phosphoribosyltransferase [Candidatus Rhodoblastus alkanivorans]MCI4679917.1 ATP phosphoribosyltransferase [Candidatus Rhodoblastus alkanivorans]MCI4681508.1 ATP phosphoribosyltransferase [Candidatus Rhodoblastus alkanivorans]MDI4642556.1 ATP phosphoribosyltransferase [Rhodoblastus acidophilus]